MKKLNHRLNHFNKVNKLAQSSEPASTFYKIDNDLRRILFHHETKDGVSSLKQDVKLAIEAFKKDELLKCVKHLNNFYIAVKMAENLLESKKHLLPKTAYAKFALLKRAGIFSFFKDLMKKKEPVKEELEQKKLPHAQTRKIKEIKEYLVKMIERSQEDAVKIEKIVNESHFGNLTDGNFVGYLEDVFKLMPIFSALHELFSWAQGAVFQPLYDFKLSPYEQIMREKQEKSLREKSPFATPKSTDEESAIELGDKDIEEVEQPQPRKMPPPLPRPSVLGPSSKINEPGFGKYVAPGFEPKSKLPSKPLWYGTLTDDLRIPTDQFSDSEDLLRKKFYRKYEVCPCGSGRVFEGCHGSNTDLI
jgi:hypothetical protein